MLVVEAKELLLEVDHRMTKELGELRSYDYLLQRISIVVQQRNAAAVIRTSHNLRNVFDLLD